MTDKLEPCPFCGGAGVQIYEMTAGSRAFAVCDLCDAEGPLAWQGADEAIRLWNTRAQKEPTP